ncbi:DUF5047 domain-containing protein [Streptomyces sp. DH12]|uniref:DUF5047 domain-containing protein n=1 Tax=Streptomyces sp. DH12 TaxID=2857010 RepID=UPI001E429250|nr:DUF5047 domain-containing protein [Streptomyces sp. DH12]
MYPFTAAFGQALTQSHTMVSRVDAHYAGAVTMTDLPIADGSVIVDRGSKARRTLSLTVADPSLLPWDAADPLAVYGQQLVVSRGIRFTSGAVEMIPLGTFRINEPSGDTLYGPVTISGQSMECAVIDDVFDVPTSTKGVGTCVAAIEWLIHQTLPGAVVVNLTAGARNPACAVVAWDAGANRWDAVVQVATAMQAEVYVDALGRFVITDMPNVLSSAAVWDIAEGEGGTLMASARTMSRTAVYNSVVASGENTSGNTPPVSAFARDTNPISPTRWGGPFGKVTKHISSGLWTTTAACQAAANAALFDAVAPNIQTSIDAAPNPALEGGDVIRVAHAGRKELFLVQSLTIPLTADGDFSISLRGGKEDLT